MLIQNLRLALGPTEFGASIHSDSRENSYHENGLGIQNEIPWQSTDDWTMSGFTRPLGEDVYQDNTEGGLYWLWDMTWNQTER